MCNVIPRDSKAAIMSMSQQKSSNILIWCKKVENIYYWLNILWEIVIHFFFKDSINLIN